MRVRVNSELSEEFEVNVGYIKDMFLSCGRCRHRICQRGCTK